MTDRAFRETQEQVSASVRATLANESRAIELRLAYVRAVALAGVTILNTASVQWPALIGLERLPPINALVAATCLLVALVILTLLRRGYHPAGTELVLPAVDAMSILVTYGSVLATSQPSLFESGMEDVAVYCAIVATSGGLRLRRAAAISSTAAALIAFLILSLAQSSRVERSSHTLVAIVVAGLFGYWLTRVVRAALEGEVGRTIFRRFLPEHLVEQAQRNPLAIVGEPRLLDATVLLTDLRGFTTLAEQLPPHELLDYLNEVQGLLAEIVRANGGVVDKFIGDGMLAVFGAHEHHEDHARRALGTAMAIIEAIERLNRQREAHGQQAAAIGIGVHSGKVIAGCVGSGSRLEFTVIGDTVNATSRLEALTKRFGVPALVSEATVQRAGMDQGRQEGWRHFQLTHRGEVTLRGRLAPLSVYSLESAT